jgi:hypothetical protein
VFLIKLMAGGMRGNMRKILLLLLLPLAGCINTAPTETQLTSNARQCTAFGYKPGTDKYADCQLALAQQSAQRNEDARARAHAFFRGLSAAGNSQRPRMTTCSRSFNYINCTSY